MKNAFIMPESFVKAFSKLNPTKQNLPQLDSWNITVIMRDDMMMRYAEDDVD